MGNAFLEASDCFREAFAEAEDKHIVGKLDICMSTYEDKRTKKWQAIFDKMK